MNTLHGISTSAVVTRLHDVHRGSEKSGAVSGRGCARGAGRQHTAPAQQGLQPYMSVVDARTGETHGGTAYREGAGERRSRTETADAEAAFTAYVQERRASLYATAYHLTGDRFEAEDLLQSALFSTYRAWDRITDKAAVGGYLRRTMTNLHISAWRRRKLNEYPTEELPETPGETDAMRGTELRAVLWQALARLPEQQRTMLVLRYYEGRTDPEIADILGISVGTVKSSIWRSLRRLREDEVLSFGRDEESAFGELVA
ncbi:SigE family RNA polymerase sigma factor [Streptomyces pluripotens]|uniref:SigE family RNA polymerase sigma factor n=1 Tax=Streptomyces pluripotens TaxID=1355015 RepID=A0A221P940_9ACTN|nr:MULTISPECIES: SigE family RNA polymerase sigma factor [Streptomyces]ARP74321.1 SigE family RNA polymerase sigma factor [Streptomyces pluripotens]ASN28596.1 SigE family RNA polymerase sigma factor [Streptomyces pluripotens]KIE26549.1 RNA polymerase [Streptomyces sp. MUSC 125]MCH0556471.1 SigE family RNA polymerase sigma factor [Streptomyces sp. MUM 16J]